MGPDHKTARRYRSRATIMAAIWATVTSVLIGGLTMLALCSDIAGQHFLGLAVVCATAIAAPCFGLTTFFYKAEFGARMGCNPFGTSSGHPPQPQPKEQSI